jgi:hypothetical protein
MIQEAGAITVGAKEDHWASYWMNGRTCITG